MPTPTEKPIISQVQSVLGFLQWQAWEFQPSAVNFPETWYCTALPPGLAFDDTTGAIFGAVVVPGVYTFALYAENEIGLSDPVTFTVGIEATGTVAPSDMLDVVVEVTTRRVSLAGAIDKGQSSAETNAGDQVAPLAPLLYGKFGDGVILNVRFTKGGVAFDPLLTALKFALKQFEPEDIILDGGGTLADSAVVKFGSGENASFRIFCELKGDALSAALSDHEADEGTQFVALGEFEWTQTNAAGVGPESLVSSSRAFGVLIARDLISN